MACSFVNNGGLDEKLFADANTEHIVVFAKLQPFLAELRQLFGDPNYNAHLEQLVMKTANVEGKLEINRKLLARWAAKTASSRSGLTATAQIGSCFKSAAD